MSENRCGEMVRYRRERGWDGRVYFVRMSEREARVIERLKLAVGIVVVVPLMIIAFAAAAGML